MLRLELALPFRLKFLLLSSVAVAWSLVAATPGVAEPSPTWIDLLWAVLAALLTGAALDSVHYFQRFRPLPGFGDLVSLVLVLPLPAMAAKWLVLFGLGETVLRYHVILLAAPAVAGAAFVAYRAVAERRLRGGRRWRLHLAVLAHERDEILEELVERRLDAHLELRAKPGQDCDLIIVSRGAVRDFDADPGLLSAHLHGAPIVDCHEFLASIRWRIGLARIDLWTFLMHALPRTASIRLYMAVRRVAEPILAAVLLVLLLPALLLIAVAIRVADPGPVLFRQLRSGYLGRPFRLIKFRTMCAQAERAGPRWSGHEDDRVTPLGRLLRASHLDELPQLVNIVRGEMSFIGPRPERPEFGDELARRIPLFPLRLQVRPGVTGWAQVAAGYAASVEESRFKLAFDLFYIQRASPKLDFIIAVRTAQKLLDGVRTRRASTSNARGARAIKEVA